MNKKEKHYYLSDFEKNEKKFLNHNYKTIRRSNFYRKKIFKNNFDFLYIWQTKRKVQS